MTLGEKHKIWKLVFDFCQSGDGNCAVLMGDRQYSQVSQAEGMNGQADPENGQTALKKVRLYFHN